MAAKRILFFVFSAILFLIMLAVLELNRNTVLGFILTAFLTAGFVSVYLTVQSNGRWYLKPLLFISWAALFFAVLLLTWPPVKAVPASSGRDPEPTKVITVGQGKLRGVVSEDGKVEIYAGIPYAKPPVGELRWKEPQDPEPWEGILSADAFAPMSMQPTNLPIYDSLARIIGYHDYKISLSDNYIPPVSEDSLYLNIWKPAGDVAGLPVIVYVHGGSLQTGQPWFYDYNGTGLAKEGAIVVNMGYRLGVFGFFADEDLALESPNGTTGNYGLLDQIKALEWVRDNIAAFGGDAGNVTLAGESAGAAAVSALCTSPLAKGLFRRAVLESSTVASKEPPHSFRSCEEAIASGNELKKRFNCESAADLRKISAEKLVAEAETQHHITVDGYVLTETPYESYRKGIHNEEQLLHGYNLEESAAFILFDNADMKSFDGKVRGYFGEHSDEIYAIYSPTNDAEARAQWAEIWGAVFFDYPHYCLNRLAAENSIPVYEYIFTKQNGRLGPWHSGEEIYLYGNIEDGSKLFDERDRRLSAEMSSYLLNFAATGDPNGEGLPEWKQNVSSEDLMEFGDRTGMTKEKKTRLYGILDRMTGFGG